MDAALNPQKQSRGITIHTDLISLVDRFWMHENVYLI
jgi:hypothetical protein